MEDFKVDLDQAEENAVFYEIHPDGTDASAQRLRELRDETLSIVAPFIEGYIWQRDSFGLQASTDQHPPWKQESPPRAHDNSQTDLGDFAASSIPFLWGSALFGDNLEDEWFITWLLFEITRCIPGVAARVRDNDGEFMLIEGAYALPRWLKPETASNRVWLLNGLMHIVPLPTAAAPDLPSFPSLKQAKQIVQGSQVNTTAGLKLQEAVAARLRGYPQKAHRQMHRARVIVPAKIAAALHGDPNLAGPAIEAFYNRDVDDMSAAAHMSHFAPQDMMSVVVTLNRCMYAQLGQQEFKAPASFSMPPAKSPQHSAAQRGMKLTCGFEMLYAKSCKTTMEAGSPAHEAGSAASSAGSGPSAGITESAGNIPGSQRYKELMQQALSSFTQGAAYRQAAAAARGPASRIDAALQSLPLESPEDEKTLEQAMQGAEDDDSWMRDGADDLERELAARQAELAGKPAASSGNGFDPDGLAQRFKAFVEQESGIEGAEVASSAPAGNPEGDVSTDYKRFWRELGDALGMQPGDSDAFLKDMASDSNDEGSSFFGDDAGEEDSSDDEDVNANTASQQDAGFMAQHAQCAAQGASVDAAPGPTAKAETSQSAPAAQGQKLSGGNGSSFSFRFPSAAAARSGNKQGPLQPGAKKAGSASTESAPGKPSVGASSAPFQAEQQAPSAAPLRHDAQKEQVAEDEQWEALTETDSDDDSGQAGSPGFMAQYAAAMEAELGGTSIGNTFARGQHPGANTQEVGSTIQHGRDAELQPVDLDVNLVENLLASYAGQQGLPGPASNLAGLMGISLPDNQD